MEWASGRFCGVIRFLYARGGGRYLLRGLREGRLTLIVVGLAILTVRFGRLWRSRRSLVATVPVEAGSPVALRVSHPGETPVTFRMGGAGQD